MNKAKEPHEVLNKPTQIYFCHACNMQFSNKKLYEVHKKQQDHLKKEKGHESKGESSQGNENIGIYVRGYPRCTKEGTLVKYFSQFGNVVWAHFGHDYLLLDFTDSSAVIKVMLKNAHILHGHRLIVKRKSPSSKTTTNDIEETEKIYRDIISELKSLNNFDEEFLCMARKLQANLTESFKKYSLICQDLYTFLSGSFPHMQVHPFGSTLTGLCFINSDVDVFLSNVRLVDTKELDYLNIIKRDIIKSGKFANCFIITTAKVPLIKCIHKETLVKCDININNILAVCNSKLIHYYMSIDLKVKQVMIVLKYWAKCLKITGPSHLISNYSLTMMFIFFLQQNPYNFPNVSSLQNTQRGDNNFSKFTWNSQFVPNYNFVSEHLFCRSILEILEDFFEFYSQFSYQTNIICPYLGKSVPRTYFTDPQSLPRIYNDYKKCLILEQNDKIVLKVDNCICVQDPFEHCRNTTGTVAMITLEKFVQLCKLGKTVCARRENVLFNLLTQQPPNINKQPQIHCEDFCEINLHKYTCIKKPQNDWFQFVVDFTIMALKEFLLITVTQVFDEASAKKDPTRESNANKLIFVSRVKENMWFSRKSTAKQLNFNINNSTLVVRETAITSYLRQFPSTLPDAEVFSFKLMMKDRNDHVAIQIRVLAGKQKSFKVFGQFLLGNLPLWFEHYVSEI